MEGRVLTLRQTMARRRLAAPIACCLVAAMLPVEPAAAEEWIPAGSGAVITAGAPLAVRAAPGRDAAVAHEIADGSPSPFGMVHRRPRTAASGIRSTAASSPSMRSPGSPRPKATLPSTRTRRRMPPRVNGSNRRPPMPRGRSPGTRAGHGPGAHRWKGSAGSPPIPHRRQRAKRPHRSLRHC